MLTRPFSLLFLMAVVLLAGCAKYRETKTFKGSAYETKVINGVDEGDYIEKLLWVKSVSTEALDGAQLKERLEAFDTLSAEVAAEFCHPKGFEWIRSEKKGPHIMVDTDKKFKGILFEVFEGEAFWSGGGDPPPRVWGGSFRCL